MKLFKLELPPPVRALSAFALMLGALTAQAAITYTWNGKGDGTRWTDPANWGKETGYPGTDPTDIAAFPSKTRATVLMPEGELTFAKLQLSNLNSNYSAVTLQKPGATTVVITLTDTAFALNNATLGTNVLDGVVLNYPNVKSNIAFGEKSQLTLKNGAAVNFTYGEGTFQFTFNVNSSLILESGSSFRHNATGNLTLNANSSIFLDGGSTFYKDGNVVATSGGTTISLAGGSLLSGAQTELKPMNSTVIIDNSTLESRGALYIGNATPGGGTIQFRGANPVLRVLGNGVYYAANNAGYTTPVVFDFMVPEGGYAEPPFQFLNQAGTTRPFNYTTCKRIALFSVNPASPALAGSAVDTMLGFSNIGFTSSRTEFDTTANATLRFADATSSDTAPTTDADRIQVRAVVGTGAAPVPAPTEASKVAATSPVTVSRKTFTPNAYVLSRSTAADSTLLRFYVGETEDSLEIVATETVTAQGIFKTSWEAPFACLDKTYYTKIELADLDASGNVLSTSATPVKPYTTLDTTTYTWTGAGGDGLWSNPANWTDDKKGDSIGYPHTADATAKFTTDAEVTVDGLYAAKLNFAVSNKRFVLKGSGIEASKITTPSFSVPGSGSTLQLDGVFIETSCGVTLNGSNSRVLLTNASKFLIGGDLSIWASGVRVELEGESYMGGTTTGYGLYIAYGGVLRIKDSTYYNQGHFIPCNNIANSTGTIRFEGKHPLYYMAANNYNTHVNQATSRCNLDFVVPPGGYEAAPVQAISTMQRNLGYNAGNPGLGNFYINLLAEDGTLAAAAPTTTDLIVWMNTGNKTYGIATTRVFAGTLPTEDAGHSIDFVQEDGYTWPTKVTATVANVQANKITVEGDPEEWLTPTPAYGTYAGATADGRTFSISPEPFVVEDGVMARATGWKLYKINGDGEWELSKAGPNEFSTTYAHESGARCRFVWTFVRRYPVSVAAAKPETCDLFVDGQPVESGASFWYDLGDEVTVKAVAKPGYTVGGWVLGRAVLSREAEVTIPVEALSHELKAITFAPEHELPSDCTVLDYIESTGNEWIDLGIKPEAGHLIDIRMAHLQKTQYTWFGCVDASVNPKTGVWMADWSGVFRIGTGTYAVLSYELERFYDLHIEVATAAYPNGAYFIDDGEHPIINSGALPTDVVPYYLFVATTQAKYPGTDGFASKMRIASLRITSYGLAPVMNLIPVMQNSEIKFFDTVSGTFFGNMSGSGKFKAGPEKGQPFEIASEQGAVGTVSPAYGTIDKVLYGATTACTATDSDTATCTGYILCQQGADGAWTEVRRGTEKSVDVIQGEESLRLVWQWQVNAAPAVAAPVVKTVTSSVLDLDVFVSSAGTDGATSTLELQYGLAANALDKTVVVGDVTNAGTFSATLSGLPANKTYFVKAVLKQNGDVVAESPVVSERMRAKHYAMPLTVAGWSGAALSGFPVPVRISEAAMPGFLYTDAVDAAHIAFSADDAGTTPYPFEVETWDPSGESVVWVRVPTLENDATFYLHWGSGVSATDNVKTEVWTDFAGVWHMGETGERCLNSTAAGSEMDALQKVAADRAGAVPGVLGSAHRNGMFTQDNQHLGYLQVEPTDCLSLGNKLTMSGWVRLDAATGVAYLFRKKGGDNETKGWGAVLTSGSYNSMTLYGSSSTTVSGATVPSTQLTWVYLTVVYDGATVSAYANGALVKSGTIASIVDDATKPLAFGALPNATSASVRGCYDECRLAGAARSADWIAADYAAQSQADFLTPGDVLTPGLNAIVVDAAPERIGEPSDGYGNCFVDGDTVHFEMNTLAVTNETELSRRVCTGWTFVPKSGATIEGTGTVAEFPYASTGTLTWQFTNKQYRVTAATLGRATVAVNGGAPAAATELWANEGDTVTVAVATEPGYNFLGWHGDVAATDQAQTTLTFADLSAKKDLTAVAAVAVGNYVQDGLVFMLDGLENVVGAHDQTTTVWKDLAGNGYDFNLVANQGHWTELGYALTGNMAAKCVLDRTKLNNKIRTCEFVWVTDVARDARFFHPGYLPSNTGLVLYTTEAGEVGFLTSQHVTDKRLAVPVETGTTNRFAITYDYESSTISPQSVLECRLNGKVVSPHEAAPYFSGEADTVLGGTSTSNKGADGRLLALRIYDRVLTPEELAHNASVDNDRFFGVRDGGFSPFHLSVTAEPDAYGAPTPAPGDYEVAYETEQAFAATPRTYDEDDGETAYPLADGVRAFLDRVDVAEDGGEPTVYTTGTFTRTLTAKETSVAWHFKDVQYRLIVRAQGNALVKIGEGEWAKAVTNWVAKDASVTVSTKDESGAPFQGWDGLAAASSANPVSVQMDQPRVVTAKYPVAFSATVDDYMTDGIQLWLDGIYNDGVDNPHGADIRYWRDLANGALVVNTNSETETWNWTDKAFVKNAKSSKFRPVLPDFAFDWSHVTLEHYSTVKPAVDFYGGILSSCLDPTANPPEIRTYYGNGNYYSIWLGKEVSVNNAKWDVGYVATRLDGRALSIWQPSRGTLSSATTTADGPTDAVTGLYVGNTFKNDNMFLVNHPINAIRLYNRVLSDYELRWNAMIDDYRFAGISPNMTVAKTTVTGVPTNWGTPSVPYGANDLMYGVETRFSVEETLTTDPFDGARVVTDAKITDGMRGVYRGWRLQKGKDVTTGTDEAVSLLLDVPLAGIEWQFERQYRILAEVNEGGTIEIVDGPSGASVTNWYQEGTLLTVRAVPNEGSTFLSWSGDTAGIPDVSAAEISVPMTGRRNLTAVFLNGSHEPLTLTWVGGLAGSWYDSSCWDTGTVPQKGDTVILDGKTSFAVTIDMSTPQLGKVVISNSGNKQTTTLQMKNWQTCLKADEIEIGAGGVVTTVEGALQQNAMSNRVWMAGGKLTVAEGGLVDLRKRGYSVGPAWWIPGRTQHYKQGGVYGGGFVGNWGSNGAPQPYGDAEWPTDPGSFGGSGGAARLDFTGAVTIDGTVNADGDGTNPSYGTTPSGGAVLIVCDTISGSGSVLARPFDRQANTVVLDGAGGGGRIAVHFNPAAQAAVTDCNVRFDASSSICSLTEFRLGPDDAYWSGMAIGDEDYVTKMPNGTLWMTDATLLKAASYATNGWKFGGRWVSPEPIGDLVFEDELVLDSCNLELDGSVTTFVAKDGVTATGYDMYGRRDNGLILSNAVVTVKDHLNASGARFEVIGGSLTVEGDVNLTDSGWNKKVNKFYYVFNGGEVAVKAMATNGTANAYGATFEVTGSVNISTNSSVYLACHKTDGAIPYMIARNVTVDEGGKISAFCGGWGAKLGPGRGAQYAPGASYGGLGAPTNRVDVSPAYGSKRRPVNPGSGADMPGGGVVRLDVEKTLTVNGSIDADSTKYMINYRNSGGSGGSVFVKTPVLLGSGAITADGALADQDGGAGGGGRVAIWTRDASGWTGTVQASGGWKCAATDSNNNYHGPFVEKKGEDGTVFWRNLPGGTLIFVR